jgi:hypothetical protein
VGQELLDGLPLFDERDNPYGPATPRADARIHLGHLLDEASTGSAERRPHARVAADEATSLHASMRNGSSPCAVRRVPRLTLLYQP